jgi:hypothetical protein
MDARIAQVLGEFDFQKVQRVMELLDWRWSSAEHGIPEIHEMVAISTRLLDDLVKGNHIETGTGGFAAYWFKDGERPREPALRFVVEDSA